MSSHHQVINSSNNITLTLLFQVLVNTAQEPERQLLGILPLQLNLTLHLRDVPEQILQLRRLRREEGQIPTGFGDEAQVQGDQAQSSFLI